MIINDKLQNLFIYFWCEIKAHMYELLTHLSSCPLEVDAVRWHSVLAVTIIYDPLIYESTRKLEGLGGWLQMSVDS